MEARLDFALLPVWIVDEMLLELVICSRVCLVFDAGIREFLQYSVDMKRFQFTVE